MTNSSSNISNHFNNKHLILGIPGKYLTRSFQSVSDGVLVLDATSQVTISLEPLLDKICHYTGLLGKFQGKIPQDSAKGARQEPRSTGKQDQSCQKNIHASQEDCIFARPVYNILNIYKCE